MSVALILVILCVFLVFYLKSKYLSNENGYKKRIEPQPPRQSEKFFVPKNTVPGMAKTDTAVSPEPKKKEDKPIKETEITKRTWKVVASVNTPESFSGNSVESSVSSTSDRALPHRQSKETTSPTVEQGHSTGMEILPSKQPKRPVLSNYTASSTDKTEAVVSRELEKKEVEKWVQEIEVKEKSATTDLTNSSDASGANSSAPPPPATSNTAQPLRKPEAPVFSGKAVSGTAKPEIAFSAEQGKKEVDKWVQDIEAIEKTRANAAVKYSRGSSTRSIPERPPSPEIHREREQNASVLQKMDKNDLVLLGRCFEDCRSHVKNVWENHYNGFSFQIVLQPSYANQTGLICRRGNIILRQSNRGDKEVQYQQRVSGCRSIYSKQWAIY